MKTLKGFVFRSKKSGNYFRFEEYCDDGYGKYEDHISLDHFSGGAESMPTVFGTDELPIPGFADHDRSEIEAVPITFTGG